MTSDVIGLRIGPLGEAAATPIWCYVAVDNQGSVAAKEYAADDISGLRKLTAALGDIRLASEAELAPAAEELGLPVRELSQELSEHRADIALDIGDAIYLPSTDPPIYRRMLLQGLGAVVNSRSWRLLMGERTAIAKIHGELHNHIFELDLAITATNATEPEIGILITPYGNEPPASDPLAAYQRSTDLQVKLSNSPAYIVGALRQAYRLAYAPTLVLSGAAPTAEWMALNGPPIGAALYGLALLPNGSQEQTLQVADPTGIQISGWCRFLPFD